MNTSQKLKIQKWKAAQNDDQNDDHFVSFWVLPDTSPQRAQNGFLAGKKLFYSFSLLLLLLFLLLLLVLLLLLLFFPIAWSFHVHKHQTLRNDRGHTKNDDHFSHVLSRMQLAIGLVHCSYSHFFMMINDKCTTVDLQTCNLMPSCRWLVWEDPSETLMSAGWIILMLTFTPRCSWNFLRKYPNIFRNLEFKVEIFVQISDKNYLDSWDWNIESQNDYTPGN